MDGLENEVEVDKLRDSRTSNEDCDSWREIFEMPTTASLPKNETQYMLLSCGKVCLSEQKDQSFVERDRIGLKTN